MRTLSETLEKRLDIHPQKRLWSAISRGKVPSKAQEASKPHLLIQFEAFLKRFVATSAAPIRVFEFQWGFYDHRNGSEIVGENVQ